MPVFQNLGQLFQYVGTVTLDEMAEEVERVAQEELLSQVRDTVYKNTSGNYENTYSLLNAVVSEKIVEGGGAERNINIETYIDPDQLDNYYESYYENGETDNRENIVGWLNDGHKGYYKGYAVNYKGREFVQKSRKAINKEMKRRLMDKMRRKGYKFGKNIVGD